LRFWASIYNRWGIIAGGVGNAEKLAIKKAMENNSRVLTKFLNYNMILTLVGV
jgi:hypothetical protein